MPTPAPLAPAAKAVPGQGSAFKQPSFLVWRCGIRRFHIAEAQRFCVLAARTRGGIYPGPGGDSPPSLCTASVSRSRCWLPLLKSHALGQEKTRWVRRDWPRQAGVGVPCRHATSTPADAMAQRQGKWRGPSRVRLMCRCRDAPVPGQAWRWIDVDELPRCPVLA